MSGVLLNGFQIILRPETFLLIFCGTLLGVVFGAMPGVSASMAVALALPFSYAMEPVIAIAFLTSVYCSSITGGGVTAILFKIPGTPANAPTTFDGYPMAQQGEAGRALGISLVCSALGGLFSAFAMGLLAPQLSAVALKFGPGELFAVSFLGLSVLSCLDSGNIVKTLISGLIGLWMACIGMDPLLGIPRFTWGNETLVSGIEMIPVMIGMFAVTEVVKQTVKPREMNGLDKNKGVKTRIPSVGEIFRMKRIILRSSAMGTLVGILPGAGATIASFLCYTTEKKISKHPDKFGTGCADGIAAAETSNNAATGGSMVPLLALGIPGGNAAAIMMSALALQGVQMGPLLVRTQPDFLSSVFSSMIVTNILMVVIAIWVAKIFARILSVPYSFLGPAIIMLAAIGSYALKNSTGDIILMAGAGMFGYMLSKQGFSAAALILGLVLGNMCESNLRRAVKMTNGNVLEAFISPITTPILLVCVVLFIYPLLKAVLNRKEKRIN